MAVGRGIAQMSHHGTELIPSAVTFKTTRKTRKTKMRIKNNAILTFSSTTHTSSKIEPIGLQDDYPRWCEHRM